MGGLGREIPKDFSHVKAMPLRSIMPNTPLTVEKQMLLPVWHQTHNQGNEGACVGFGTSMMLSILNEHQCRTQGDKTPYIHYNPWWLWKTAKTIDGIEHVDADEGTTVNAACTVLKTQGHVLWNDENNPESFSDIDPSFGIAAVRWGTSVDQIRTAINADIPVSLGVNWYGDFDDPIYIDTEYWIGKNGIQKPIRGGHDVCLYGASDRRQAVKLKNSWGASYPEVWVPYSVLERLLSEDGEASMVTDR
jgi:hypothetical protein